MKKFLLFVVVLSGIAGVAFADVTKEDIAASLRKDLRHPYLFFTDDEKPSILDRIKTDFECSSLMARFSAEAERFMYMPVNPIPEQPKNKGNQLFEPDTGFSGMYYTYRDAALILAFVYQMTGDEKYARKSFEFAREICDMPTWVMRFCQYPKAHYRVSPWNVTDDKVVFTFAIVSSDTASMMAMVYDWLYPALTKDERDWIRAGLLEKAITRVRGNYDYQWWATAYRCNWCAWCNTGLGLAALTLLCEDPKLTEIVAESYNRISRTFDEIDIDGGWQEGVGYWAQMLRMSSLFADALNNLTNGACNLFEHPKIKANTVNFPLYTYVPPHYGVNFADAGYHAVGSPRMYNKLALETGSKEAAWLYENLFEEGDDIFDIIWPRNAVKPSLPEKTSIHFRGIEWVVMRNDFIDPEKVMVACKAGKNDDSHHGHLDNGQFTVFWRGEAYIADLGTAEYDEKYFDAEKYDTPHASSRGHNLIFVNGEQQIPGKLFGKPIDETIGGKVIEFRDGVKRVYALLDPTNAYAKKELKKWRRHIILDKPVVTVVVDEVESEKGTEIEARFHSASEQIVKDGYTLLHGKAGDMALIPVVDGSFSFRPSHHAYLALFEQANFRWIPYIGTVLHAKDTKTVIAHIILPVENERGAEAVVKSVKRSFGKDGSFSLSFSKDGMVCSYVFKKKEDGLVLE